MAEMKYTAGKSKGRGSMKSSDSVVMRQTFNPNGTSVQEFPMDGSKAEKPTWNQSTNDALNGPGTDAPFLKHKSIGN